MRQWFFVRGPLPGLNEFLGTGDWRYYNGRKRQWMKVISDTIIRAGLKPMNRAQITWIWHEPTRRRDPDNITGIGKKFVLDALVSCEILPDDGWDEVSGWSDMWLLDKEYVGVEVILDGMSKGGEEVMATKKPVKKVAKKAVKKPFKASVSKKSKPVAGEAVVVDHY